MARRRRFSVISMSFLDAMTCGFGAVILFYMIISANIDLRHDEVLEDRSAEVRRLELQVDVGRQNLAQLREALAILLQSMASTQGARDQIRAEIQQTEAELERLMNDSSANQEMIEQLRAELSRLQTEAESLSAEAETVEEQGEYIRAVRGEGYRQYLTGMRMGGERILILVDVSTSMLDRTVVGVIRRSIMPNDADKLAAPKWQQIVGSVDWLTAQIPPGAQFQVVAFNSEAWSLIEGTDGQWLTASDGSELEQAVETLRNTVPGSCRPEVVADADPARGAEADVDTERAGADTDAEAEADGAEAEADVDAEVDGAPRVRTRAADDDRAPCGATSLHAAFRAMNQMNPPPDNVYLLVDGLPTMGADPPRGELVTGRQRLEHFERASREIGNNVPINVLLYALEGDPQSAPAYWTIALRTGGSLMAPSDDWP